MLEEAERPVMLACLHLPYFESKPAKKYGRRKDPFSIVNTFHLHNLRCCPAERNRWDPTVRFSQE